MALVVEDLSNLPELPINDDTAVFVQNIESGDPKSGKTLMRKIIAFVEQVAARLQIERKFTYTISELNPMQLIGEQTTIYGVEVLNVASLRVTVEEVPANSAGNWEPGTGASNTYTVDITPGAVLNIAVPKRSVITVDATPISTDTKRWFVWFNAKAVRQ